MKRHSEIPIDWDAQRAKIIGLGENSIQKSYYPELQRRLADLELFRALLDQSNDSIFIARAPSFILIDVNEPSCRQLEYTRGEMLSLSFMDLIPPSESQRIKALLAAPEIAQRGVQVTVTLRKRGGATVPVEMNIRFVEMGDAVYLVAVVRDITERKRAEEELYKYREQLEELVTDRTRELEEKNRKLGEEIIERRKTEEEKRKVEAQLSQAQKIEALGSFAGGIAHDLNNILYPVIINTEILLEDTEMGTNCHEMLNQTLQAAYRQRDLVKQILSFSRQGVQKFTPIQIAPLLNSTLDFIRSTLPSTIEIRRSIDAASDVIMGDPIQIQQVIMNLCKNAADALASQRGFIEVSLSDKHLDPDPARPDIRAGEYLEIAVRDTGHGIPPDVVSRIFDPFFTTKGFGKGSGMGLSVVHGVLKRHGASIRVESEEGKGSRFAVHLPLYDQKTNKGLSGRKGQEKGSVQIMLVDDERIILSSLKHLLQRLGYKVTTAENGLEALESFRKAPDEFDLVVTDMVMPEITGIELGRRLLDIRPDVPVILCTGYSDTIDDHEVKGLGFHGLLMKPVGTSELKKAISLALGAGVSGGEVARTKASPLTKRNDLMISKKFPDHSHSSGVVLEMGNDEMVTDKKDTDFERY